MALGAPSLQHERTAVIISVDGAQPEDDGGQEEMCSQVDDVVMSEANSIPPPPPPKVSSRLANQGNLATEWKIGPDILQAQGIWKVLIFLLIIPFLFLMMIIFMLEL
jgi:hypothetical protein